MKLSIGKMWLGGMLALGLAPTLAMAADDYPNKPITIIVPYAPGGTTDVVGRALADSLSRQLGQTVIVENKPGAAGAMGVIDMMGTKPDGYRLTMAPVGIFRQPYLQETRYDPIRDLTYIASFMTYDFAVTVKADAPYQTVQDLVDAARKEPGSIDYSSTGRFTANHVALAMLGKNTGVTFTHIPYKGDSDATAALMGGHVKVGVITNSILAHVRAGAVRVLATSDAERNPAFEDVPTMKELGFDVLVPSPQGLAGPANLPEPIVEKLDLAVKAALQDPDVLRVLDNFGVRTAYMDHKTYADFARKTFAAEKDIVVNLDLENN